MRPHLTGPTVEGLRTFALLADLLGEAEVARRLGVETSSVSRRLRPFRERYRLLEKRGGSLVLTDRGRALLPAVQALLQEYDNVAGLLRGRPSPGQRLTLAVGSFGAVWVAPEVVARFLREHPGTEVEARTCRGRERIQGVADGRYDLAIVSHSLVQIRAQLGDRPVSAQALAAAPFAVAARRGSPAGDALATVPDSDEVTVRELAPLPLVGLDEASGVRAELERQADAAGVRLRFGTGAGGWLAAREYARHGLGVGIVPVALIGRNDREDLVLRLLARALWPTDHLLYRPAEEDRVGALRRVVVDFFLERAQLAADTRPDNRG